MESAPASKFANAAELAGACARDSGLCTAIESVTQVLAQVLAAGGTVLVAGNGGSMAQASHLAEECTGRFRVDRRPFAVLSLDSATHLSCTANDYGFEEVFARGVSALGRPGDALLVLSTSGESENLVRAVTAAKDKEMSTSALLGRGGGRLNHMVDQAAVFPGSTPDEVQDLHMVAIHAILIGLEEALCNG